MGLQFDIIIIRKGDIKTILDFPSFSEIFNTEFRNTLPCLVATAGISSRRKTPKGASYFYVIAHAYV